MADPTTLDFDVLLAARGITALPQTRERAVRVSAIAASPTYASVVANFVPAANPTDVAYLGVVSENRSVTLRRLAIRATGDAAGFVDVYLIFSAAGAAGTPVTDAVMEPSQVAPLVAPTGGVYTWLANPTLGGGRTTIAQAKLQIGTAAVPAPEMVFDFTGWERPPTIRAVSGAVARQIALNFNGQALPANTKLDMNWRRVEESVSRKVFVGNSLFSAANTLFRAMNETPGVTGSIDIRNYGSNGKRLLDLLPTAAQNTSGLTYNMASVANAFPAFGASGAASDLILHYLTNDVRTGDTSLPQAISLIDAFIYIMKNGCTSGQTWVSTKTGGAGTSFTWNATISPRPNVRLWLYGENSYLADDPTSSGSITSTGLFSGMTMAQAAQAATDIVYNAYQAFVGDTRVAGVLQAQGYISPTLGIGFGRTVATGANSPLMLNQLHPNSNGEAVKAEQLAAIIAL